MDVGSIPLLCPLQITNRDNNQDVLSSTDVSVSLPIFSGGAQISARPMRRWRLWLDTASGWKTLSLREVQRSAPSNLCYGISSSRVSVVLFRCSFPLT